MKKLIGMFRSLPKEVQMMIAMAGLGTPLGAIYIMQRFLFPGMPIFFVILIVGGVVLGICLLGFLISKIFGRGKRKRNKKLAADLAADAEGGMASVDVRAAIKSNNEKFFGAIREMRKGLGISVYDLPWYIVLGDSGCGKTKLINEGGLTFSTGRPEGYQLGTLNYNWWFTEDAIFVDMAGRLCNPKDDADRKEWEAFLGTVGKGRKGYPINGALLCVSADHLLADPPEKIEQDANTALERLRDLQNRLGVTFATYLIVTKCDKIVGFMQYFDRAERDITVKNQIFGISRPGAFNELYDPEQFKPDFDALYGRLNELRLRRMNDDSDEGDLGLAYGFPEEWRELREPLQTYIRMLFPAIKKPRAVKNLIYRGTFFTSATQEGALILKHLTERLGAEAADQFQSLDLYPNKRPHFIKDVLFRKVFPEHGLVFRNEEEALRKRKWAKILKVASIVLGVGLVGTLAASSVKFNGVIGKPRTDAKELGPQDEATPQDALALAGDLGRDVDSLQENLFWAGLLSWGVGTTEPIEHLQTIQAGIFEKVLLRQVLLDVGQALRSADLVQLPRDEEGRHKAQQYADALEQYALWAGCAEEKSPPQHLDLKGLKAMCAVVEDPETFVRGHSERFWSQAANYFNVIRSEGGNWKNPARVLSSPGHEPDQTVRQGVVQMHEYLKRYAELTDQHPDPLVREWMRLRGQCVGVEDTYTAMLDAAEQDPETREQLQEFKDQFVGRFDKFGQALDDCAWQGEQSGPYVIIKPLREALLAQREQWIGYQQKLTEAYAQCPSSPESTIPASIAALRQGSPGTGLPGLDRVMWESLKSSRLVQIDYHEDNFEEFQNLVREIPDEYGHVITLVSGGGTKDDQIVLTEGVSAVRGVLKSIRDKLAAFKLEPSSDTGTPDRWEEKLFAVLDEAEKDLATTVQVDKFDKVWRPEELANLEVTQQYLIARGVATQLLANIDARLGRVGPWGFAELVSDDEFLGKEPSVYRIPLPTRSEEDRSLQEEESDDEEKPKARRRTPRRTRRRASSARRSSEATDDRETGLLIPPCATPAFLMDRAEECINLQVALGDFDESLYFPGESDDIPLHEACLEGIEDAAQTYMEAYLRAWSQAYKAKDLRDLERMVTRAREWRSLANMMGSQAAGAGVNRDDVGDEFQQALVEILSALPFWTTFQDENGAWAQQDLNDADWRDVAYWWGQAVDSWWPSDLGRFAERAQVPREVADTAPGEAPARLLADEFVRRWRALADGIASNAELPRSFEEIPRRQDKRGIPWGQIEALRQEARLDDEKLTNQLVAFEQRAQELLSEELTDVLCDIQDKYFRRERPFDGWPYLSPTGEGPSALETVGFESFKSFLLEVTNARKVFEPIEATLPKDDQLGQERDGFYRKCQEWVDFMRLGDDLVPEDLVVEIAGGDPVMPPYGKERVQDTAQHYYEAVELDLGLAVPTEEAAGGDIGKPLRVATLYEEKVRSRKCTWDWTARTDATELSVALADSWPIEGSSRTYPTVKRVVGESSPLALCAYLHRYGVRADGKWITVHRFDLVEELKNRGQSDLISGLKTDITVVGEKFEFNLTRPMPEPIEKLERAAHR